MIFQTNKKHYIAPDIEIMEMDDEILMDVGGSAHGQPWSAKKGSYSSGFEDDMEDDYDDGSDDCLFSESNDFSYGW